MGARIMSITQRTFGHWLATTLGLLIVCAAAPAFAQSVTLRVAHFAPIANTPEGTNVSVRVNGTQILENFRYKDFTPEISLPSGGNYRIEVFPRGSSVAAINNSVSLIGGRSYILAAVGNGVEQPLAIASFDNDTPAPTGLRFKLRVAHAAPFAAGRAEVSVRTDAGDVVAGLARLPYLAAGEFLELPANPAVDIKIANPSGDVNLIDAQPLNVLPGVVTTVFAVGDGRNQRLGLIAVPLGELSLEGLVSQRANGLWSDPQLPGQGFQFVAIPRENRLIGTLFGYDGIGGGSQRWYYLDTCRTPVGQSGCANPGVFDDQVAVFGAYETFGGRLLQSNPVTTQLVGTVTVTFRNCQIADVTYRLPGIFGTNMIQNLTPTGCPPQ